MRSPRLLAAVIAALLLSVAATIPVAAAREFGTIYVDGDAYRTFGTPARVDPGTGTDPIISFTNFAQGGVAKEAPGPGSHGGRWEVWMATWVDPTEAELVTDFDAILALRDAGKVTLDRVEEADFRCPILPDRGRG